MENFFFRSFVVFCLSVTATSRTGHLLVIWEEGMGHWGDQSDSAAGTGHLPHLATM